jgi:hypothetical protein
VIPVLAIARATVIELRRQRLMIVPAIGIVLSLVVLGAALILADGDLSLRDEDAELAALSAGIGAAMAGTVYAIIVGSGLIAREIVGGTMLMLAARPIGRWQIILGRVLGAGAFLLAVLLGVCLSYSLVAMVTSGSTAPFDEPFQSFGVGAPAVLLGLCFGIACSVQGKATAATGAAIAIALFAWSVGIYAQDWRDEHHERSFLTEDVRDEIDSDNPVIGRGALAVARALPFWVFTQAAITQVDDHESYQQLPGWEDPDRVDTTKPSGMTGFATAVPVDPNVALPNGPGPIGLEDLDLPDEPTEEAFDCSEYGGADCFLGYRDAWTVKEFERAQPMDRGVGLLFAWLAIPLWIGIAMLLLHRRRDLT